MTTPGAIKRRLDGAWVQEGSFVLRVPTFADLPAAPSDDDVFAFVHATERLYRSRSGAWIEFHSQGAAVLHRGSAVMDLGSITTGGLRDLAVTTIPTQTVSAYVQVWGYISIGFGGAGPCTGTMDLVRVRDSAMVDGVVGASQAPAGASIRYPMFYSDAVSASVNPNVKTRWNGTNYSGGNCYVSSALHWIVTDL